MKRAVILGLAVLLVGTVSIALASKEDDAIRATKVLKTTKVNKEKIEAIVELGAIAQIKRSYTKDAIPLMITCCKDKDAQLRASAAENVGKTDPDPELKVLELLTDMLKNDKDQNVRVAAARGLANMGSAAKAALPTLREIAKKEDKKSKLSRATMDAAKTISNRK